MPPKASYYQLPKLSKRDNPWILLGSELSPFTLKVMNYCAYLKIPFQLYYQQGSLLQNIRYQIKKMLLTSGLSTLTWPKMSSDDEYPLLPFLFGPKGESLYDSSAIAYWFDQQHNSNKLIPQDSPIITFLIRLIDEYADEFGLYLVHHNRWVISASDNDAGARLSKELKTIAGPFQLIIGNFFSARQIRRLPYLFSTTETKEFLDDAFVRLLKALEEIFIERDYLFGDYYTLADASIYGQLAMNLPDPSAAKIIKIEAPATYAWLTRLANLNFAPPLKRHNNQNSNNLELLVPLLSEINRTFIPLMEQNSTAVVHYKNTNQQFFNEKAFNIGEALYKGEVDGNTFNSVAKTFQHRVWKEIKQHFQELEQSDQQWLIRHCPNCIQLNHH